MRSSWGVSPWLTQERTCQVLLFFFIRIKIKSVLICLWFVAPLVTLWLCFATRKVDAFSAHQGHRCVSERHHPHQTIVQNDDARKSPVCHWRRCLEGRVLPSVCHMLPETLRFSSPVVWPEKTEGWWCGPWSVCSAVNNLYQHVKSRWSKNAASGSIISRPLSKREQKQRVSAVDVGLLE